MIIQDVHIEGVKFILRVSETIKRLGNKISEAFS